MNTRYIVAMVLVLMVGGFFAVRSMTSNTPTTPVVQEQDEVFGEGAKTVGTLEPIMGPGVGTTLSMKTITRTDLLKHNIQTDCWVAYLKTDGMESSFVYDITSWLPRHPGSAAAIAPYCGTAEEFTAAFTRKHSTSKEGRLDKEGVGQGILE